MLEKTGQFESFVNSERCKTMMRRMMLLRAFESFVNSERCKTTQFHQQHEQAFESFVNSERCKTDARNYTTLSGLRALLIQKDVKPI